MTSYIVAAGILGTTVLIVATWLLLIRRWPGRMGVKDRSAVVLTALGILAAGSALAWVGFTMTRRMAVTTLHEVMLKGTINPKEGEPSPLRETSFRVEHPGVEHELFFSPTANSQDFPAEVAVRLLDPTGEVVLEERHTFVPRRDGGRFSSLRWPGRRLFFQPAQEGTYRLVATPLTIGLEGIHVHITDPEKTDGQRMPGY